MPTPSRVAGFVALALALAQTSTARQPERAPKPREIAPAPFTAASLKGFELRAIGPCITPGRIGDIAIDPKNRNVWYVAMSSGGVWKTVNRGISWTPIFDNYISYSIGCLAIDPKNSDVVWVGTGENQSQRSVGFGDGLYKSTDGGKKFSHVGLKNSEHIAKILIDPRNSDVVYVAAQGPLWKEGGDRGLYKTTDGGKTWKAVLEISENTGVTDVCFDSKNPDILYAASYQRRRHVGVLIGGGPEAAIYKSTDAGKKWEKLTNGLPEVNLGRIALATSPQKEDVVYAHIQTAGGKERGAFFRTEDGGKTWAKRGVAQIQDGQYYGEIYADPHKFDRVWVMDMIVQVTDDGGKTFRRQQWATHVDHHAIAFDPTDENHIISGNDGGLYESYDAGRTWRHFDTLSSTQFYRICVDNSTPFYNIYGGTQDNGTMGGPVRSKNTVGVRTSDWGKVGGGDGFQPRVDPNDPDTVYTQSQNGALARLDRTTGRSVSIRPGGKGGKGKKDDDDGDDPKADEEAVAQPQRAAVRWNWDSPLIISPHNGKRLYFAGSKLFRSDDRGDNWKTISPDLTRDLDPLKIEVMGKVWGDDAVSRNTFTTSLSVATALCESPVKEGLLYVGTDDGLVQVSEDAGQNWRKIDTFPGVPEGTTWVTDVFASNHDADTVYASFFNWQRGDFKPYLLRSRDRGKSWHSIAGNLPDRHGVWSVVEDHVNRDLLFAGTEFGLFVTVDGGKNWVKVPGAPPIPFRDLEIHRREGDLVCGTFGRGIYVLDDYGALRALTEEARTRDAVLCPVRKTWGFVETPFASRGGEFSAPNPPPGAGITYHLREAAKGKVVIKVADPAGKTIREISGPATAGVHRVQWDLRPTGTGGGGPGGGFRGGAIVRPGKYTVTLTQVMEKDVVVLGEPQVCEVVPLTAAATAQP
jgi:photosystem II stability/assembly factor-like uncharacterized protein